MLGFLISVNNGSCPLLHVLINNNDKTKMLYILYDVFYFIYINIQVFLKVHLNKKNSVYYGSKIIIFYLVLTCTSTT